MNKISTIKELKERVWYRILKVVFVVALISLLFLVNAVIIAENWPEKYIDVNNTLVHCKKANTDFVLSAVEKNDFLYASDMDNKLDLGIWIHCGLIYNELNPQEKSKGLTEEQKQKIRKTLEYNKLGIVTSEDRFNDASVEDQYTINYKTYWSNRPITLIFGIVAGTVGTWLLFGLIQRIFYYIVLGKFKPPKN